MVIFYMKIFCPISGAILRVLLVDFKLSSLCSPHFKNNFIFKKWTSQNLRGKVGSSDVIKRSNISVAKRVEFECYIPTTKFVVHFPFPCSFFSLYIFFFWNFGDYIINHVWKICNSYFLYWEQFWGLHGNLKQVLKVTLICSVVNICICYFPFNYNYCISNFWKNHKF